MAYSFVKTGGSGEAYDIIAEDIQGTIFFAGEVWILIPNPSTCILISFSSQMISAQSSKTNSNTVKSLMTTDSRSLLTVLFLLPEAAVFNLPATPSGLHFIF